MSRLFFLSSFICIVFLQNLAFAKAGKLSDIQASPEASRILESTFSANACISPFAFNFQIVQKTSDHEYVIRGEGGSFINGILKTQRAIYDSTGIPVGIKIKHLGKKSYPLQNGFLADFQIWEECSYDEKIDCVTYRSTDPSATWPRRPKDIKCTITPKRELLKKKVETKSFYDINDCSADCYYRLSDKKSEALKCYESCDKKYGK